MLHAYDDEDNVPMNEDAFDGFHNPTVYLDRAEMKAAESIPFSDPPEPPSDGCWNCMNFDWKHEACTTRWNNMDESYYNPDIDDRQLTDWCEDHEEDKDVKWEDVFDGDNGSP